VYTSSVIDWSTESELQDGEDALIDGRIAFLVLGINTFQKKDKRDQMKEDGGVTDDDDAIRVAV
jgi:hypothetical protein